MLLVEGKAEIEAKDSEGWTALHLAAQLEEHLRWPDRHPPAW